jgi:hypothetical protein
MQSEEIYDEKRQTSRPIQNNEQYSLKTIGQYFRDNFGIEVLINEFM